MTLLVCREADVLDHWKQTVDALRGILPESGGHYVSNLDTSGYEVEISIGNASPETTPRYTGGFVPIVPFLDVPTGQPSIYWMSWHEAWRPPQIRPRAKFRQFRSSSIAIYSGLPGCAKSQVLRAEWAGAEAVQVGKKSEFHFQGGSAAHPHWHLAGLEAQAPEDAGGGLAQFENPAPSRTGLGAFVDSIGVSNSGPAPNSDLAPGVPSVIAGIAPAWARIHLAASARWAQQEWNGPGTPNATHASNPANCGEIRSWIVSCVRYLQSELQGQVRRRRM